MIAFLGAISGVAGAAEAEHDRRPHRQRNAGGQADQRRNHGARAGGAGAKAPK